MMKYIVLLFSLLVIAFSYKANAQQEIFDDLEVNGKISAISTTSGSHPCPSMSDAEMLAIASPSDGDCVNNSTLNTWLVYDAVEEMWEEVGSGGGLSAWVTATDYEIGDVVHINDKIYIALTNHTSGTFATDLSSGDWLRLNDEFNFKADNDSLFAAKEIQVPHSQLTEVDANKARLETGNKNRLENPGFEHTIALNGWLASTTGSANLSSGVELTDPIEGKKSAEYTCDGTAGAGTCTVYQDASTSHRMQAISGIIVQSSTVWNATNSTGVKVYSRVDGINSQSKKLETTDAKFLGIPVIFGSTSTGVAVEVTVASGQSITWLMDEGTVEAQDVKQDIPVIGPWTSYTPTFTNLGTVTNINARWRQVGSNIELQIKATTGTVTSSTQSISLPSGFTVASFLGTPQYVGKLSRPVSSATYFSNSVLATPNTNYVNFGTQSSASNDLTVVTAAAMSNSETFSLMASVPVNELSSSTTSYSSNESNAGGVSNIVFNSSTVAPRGFISAMNKTIGKSSGDYQGAEYKALYDVLWAQAGLSTTAGDVYTISSAKGASAQEDWDAGKTIKIDYETNSPFIRAAGTGRTLGQYRDSENKAHTHSVINGLTPNSNISNGGVQGMTTTNAQSQTTSSSGGTESHPKEVALNVWIQYQSYDVIIGTFNEVVTTPGVSKPKKCIIQNSGATNNTTCNSSPCIEYYDTCGTASACTRTSTGVYTCAWGNGTWAPNSYISCYMNPSNTIGTVASVATSDANGAFTVLPRTYSTGTTVGDAFFTIACEGQAP